MVIWPIAVNTFRESIRNRVLLNILLFAVVIIVFSSVIGDWAMSAQIKIIKDLGLSAMSVFGLLIALFIGIRLMVQEFEQRTIYIIASKPIHRWNIVLGKFLGLALTIALNLVFMMIVLLLVILIMQGELDFSLSPAIVLIYIEILLIVGFSMLFSTVMSPQLAAITTLFIFITGHLSEFLREYVQVHPDRGFHWLLNAIYYVVPNLEKLNIKMTVVENTWYSPHAFLFRLIYGIAYISLVFMITAFVFNKKDLK
ncbi:ABC transporter permease subunit [bacterium]|nr:ABC transporter permease subunit [candidate division CSSED10-310 bacterium]